MVKKNVKNFCLHISIKTHLKKLILILICFIFNILNNLKDVIKQLSNKCDTYVLVIIIQKLMIIVIFIGFLYKKIYIQANNLFLNFNHILGVYGYFLSVFHNK